MGASPSPSILRPSGIGRQTCYLLGLEIAAVTSASCQNTMPAYTAMLPADSEVMIAVSRDNDIVRVEVRDRGSGIERGQLQNIFERFQRTDASRSRETGGYGLGLAIAKAMTEAYGGSIAAESQPGQGTMFSVRLPASKDSSASLKV